ncbi:hypothetical protein D3C85_1430700 [compost metagenome]
MHPLLRLLLKSCVAKQCLQAGWFMSAWHWGGIALERSCPVVFSVCPIRLKRMESLHFSRLMISSR